MHLLAVVLVLSLRWQYVNWQQMVYLRYARVGWCLMDIQTILLAKGRSFISEMDITIFLLLRAV